jgi:hypothetical protein
MQLVEPPLLLPLPDPDPLLLPLEPPELPPLEPPLDPPDEPPLEPPLDPPLDPPPSPGPVPVLEDEEQPTEAVARANTERPTRRVRDRASMTIQYLRAEPATSDVEAVSAAKAPCRFSFSAAPFR